MPLSYENRRRQITLNVTPYIYEVDAVALSLINQFKTYGADPEITKLDDYKLSLTFRESDELTYEAACQKILWNQYVQNIEQKSITNNIELLRRMVDPYFDSPVVAGVNDVRGDGKGQLDGISPSSFIDGEELWANGKPIKQPSYTIGDEEIRVPAGGPLPLSRDLNKDVQTSTITAKSYYEEIGGQQWNDYCKKNNLCLACGETEYTHRLQRIDRSHDFKNDYTEQEDDNPWWKQDV